MAQGMKVPWAVFCAEDVGSVQARPRKTASDRVIDNM